MSAIPIKGRIAPSYPLKLELDDDDGGKLIHNFRLSFDFNAFARIEERLPDDLKKAGVTMLDLRIWTKLSAGVVGLMLWAAVLAKHPQYLTVDEEGEPTDEGLEVIRSFIDLGNATQIGEALWEAYLLNFPKQRAEELRKLKAGDTVPNGPAPAADPPPAESQDGSSSGPQLATTSVSATASSGS